MAVISVWLSERMDKDLRRLSQASGESISKVVRVALRTVFGAGELGYDFDFDPDEEEPE